ncbi:enhancin-2 [Betabaculovirus altermyunipunctae]|uniref:Enhancin-2 n=1 Tax=Betabaculovirus altermyunipunctae TaxID=3051996 RepID=A0A1S5YE25_9BBAC|nr:enhancin-2 [Betabaculovirus altermyunipunctae]AQQ80402.1 enhancin-2 [Betabaculovirus altermyunipunctae]
MACVESRNSDLLLLTVPVPSLRVPPYLRETDGWMALRHGRVPAGIMVYASATVSCRLAENSPAVPTTVRFLNNNRATEHSLAISTFSWTEYTVLHDSVVFVDRTLNSVATRVEFKVDGVVCEVPVYVHGATNESQFKSEYSASECPYALIRFPVVDILVPPADKANVLQLDLQALQSFYSLIVGLYDDLAGLRSDARSNHGIDDNFDKRFFAKADATGAGAAYYSATWTANSRDTLGNYLQARPGNWLVFHEFGHAYDFMFVVRTGLNEVWNNVYSDRMQFQLMDKAQRQTMASVYENGNRARVETDVMGLIESSVSYFEWSHFQKLTIFTFIMNTQYGPDTWRVINAQFRLLRSIEAQPVYPNIALWLLDACPADLAALFGLFSIHVPQYSVTSARGIARSFPYLVNVAHAKHALYPIKYLVPDFDVLTANDYNFKRYLESNLDLVTPHELIQTDLQINILVIQCVIGDVAQVAGEPFAVYDGLTMVFKGEVNSSGIVLITMLGPGVYTMRAPRGRDKRYHVSFNEPRNPADHLIIDGKHNVYRLHYTEYTHNSLLPDVGHVLGINDVYSLEFRVRYDLQVVEIKVYFKAINSNFGTRLYFSITIEEPSGLFELSGSGDGVEDGGVYRLAFTPERSIMNVYHAQANMHRVWFLGRSLTALTVQYRLLADSVVPVNTNIAIPSRAERLLAEIEHHARWLDSHPVMLAIENEARDFIFVGVQTFEGDEQHDVLTERYNRYFPDYYRIRHYQIDMNGFSDLPRFTFVCDLLLGRADLTRYTAPSGPNVHFGTSDYIGFELINDTNVSVLKQLFQGSQSFAPAQFSNLPIGDGYRVELFHAEPRRIQMSNNDRLITDVTFTENTVLVVRGQRFHMLI